MKKKTVYLVQKVVIEYNDDKQLNNIIKDLKKNPNFHSTGSKESGGWRKHEDVPTVFLKKPIHPDKVKNVYVDEMKFNK